MTSKCCIIDMIAWTLMIIGGLNWGLVGAFNFNLVAYLLGDMSTLARVVYIIVGLASIYGLISLCKKHCCKKSA